MEVTTGGDTGTPHSLCQHLAWGLPGGLSNANLEEQSLGRELLERWHLSLALPSHSTRSFLAHAVTAFTSGNDSLVTAPPPPPAPES